VYILSLREKKKPLSPPFFAQWGLPSKQEKREANKKSKKQVKGNKHKYNPPF